MNKLLKSVFIAFIFSLSILNISVGEEIYYINTAQSLQQSELGKIAEQIVKQEETKLRKKYKFDIKKLQSGQQVSEEEIRNYLTYNAMVNKLIKKVSENTQRIIKEKINKFAQAKGYNIIVAEVSVVYSNDKYNKTKEFINFINREVAKNKTKIISELKK